MIHPLIIDDQTQKGQMFIRQFRRNQEEIEIINRTNDTLSHGYITLEQLRKNALNRLEKLYKENGLLK